MTRWRLYLLPWILFEISAYVAAIVLPLFAIGKPYLPRWLRWYGQPDNDLDGDRGWRTDLKPGTYKRRMLWLLKNPAYNFGIDVLGARITPDMVTEAIGDVNIKARDHGRAGSYFIRVGPWWNKKTITDLGMVLGKHRCRMAETGWKLQDYGKAARRYPGARRLTVERAQFVVSWRTVEFNPAPV